MLELAGDRAAELLDACLMRYAAHMRMMAMALCDFTIPMGEPARAETEPMMGFVFRPRRLVLVVEPAGPVRDVGRFYLLWGYYRGKSRRKGRRASLRAASVLLRISKGERVTPRVNIVNITVGVNSQFAGPGSVPASLFSPSAIDMGMNLDPSMQGKVIGVDFVNDDARDVRVTGSLFGDGERITDIRPATLEALKRLL